MIKKNKLDLEIFIVISKCNRDFDTYTNRPDFQAGKCNTVEFPIKW